MDEEPGSNRVEIELTQHEGQGGRRGRRRRGDGAAEPSAGPVAELREVSQPAGASVGTADGDGVLTVGDGGVSVPGDDRRRLIVTALGVGAVALFVGWVLGRAGGDTGEARAVEGASTSVSATTVPSTLLPGDTLPGAVLPPAPTTTRPRPSTTTTLPPEWQTSTVEVDPRLAGATDRIVAVTSYGGLLELDVATGQLRSLPPVQVATTSSYYNPYPPIAGRDWILVPADRGDGSIRSLLYRDGSSVPLSSSVGGPWETTWQLDTELFWQARYSDNGAAQTLVEIGLDGVVTGREIDLSGGYTMGADPSGGVLVTDGVSGVFRVTAESSSRLPEGRPLAVGVDTLLLYRCGDSLADCGLVVVDRATGDERPLPLDDALAPYVGSIGRSYGAPASRPAIAPDASRVIITAFDGQGFPVIGVVDLTTGRFTEFTTTPDSLATFSLPSAVWSADSRFIYTIDVGAVVALDVATGELIKVAAPLDTVSSLTVRPAET